MTKGIGERATSNQIRNYSLLIQINKKIQSASWSLLVRLVEALWSLLRGVLGLPLDWPLAADRLGLRPVQVRFQSH